MTSLACTSYFGHAVIQTLAAFHLRYTMLLFYSQENWFGTNWPGQRCPRGICSHSEVSQYVCIAKLVGISHGSKTDVYVVASEIFRNKFSISSEWFCFLQNGSRDLALYRGISKLNLVNIELPYLSANVPAPTPTVFDRCYLKSVCPVNK